MALPQGPDQRWSLDFVSDVLTDGRRFRVLVGVDDFTPECLALIVDTSIFARRVARELDAIVGGRRLPLMIVSDNVLSRDARALCGQQISMRRCRTGRRGLRLPSGFHRRRNRFRP
jgi:putative transposase